MPTALIFLALLAGTPIHDRSNPTFAGLFAEPVQPAAKGRAFAPPAPSFGDDDTPEAMTAAVEKVTGSKTAAREFLKAAVASPFILKVRDDREGSDHVRFVDCWFAIRADLDKIDVAQVASQNDDQATEAGNMKFRSRRIPDGDLKAAGKTLLPAEDGRTDWFTHMDGRLLDRIAVETTSRVTATRSPNSLVIASRTDHDFGSAGRYPNRWAAVTRQGATEQTGPSQAYGGGGGYVKISKFAAEPGLLLVESHVVFFEPHDWFQGAPILRSKFGVVAQDQIRRLRRETEPNPGEKRTKASEGSTKSP